MERYELEALLALADELHFARAAERLRVSPSRISRIVQTVERRLGATLFERTSRQVTLTPIGKQFLDELRPGHDQIQRAVARATQAGRGIDGVLTVGFLGPAAGRVILTLAADFRAEHPGVDVRIREIHMSEGVAAWRSDRFDMMLLERPVGEPDFVTGPTLFREARVLAVSDRHPLATRAAITSEDLAQVALIRMPSALPAEWVAARAPHRTPGGLPIPVFGEAHSCAEILSRVGAGEGAFVVGEQAVRYDPRPDIVYLPITDAPPIEWGFVWHATRETARVRAFNAAAVASVAQGHTGFQPALAGRRDAGVRGA
ncbi:LysR family transcriptional regulator [Nocardia sp. 2]|uniref:LysR family transcriptional regulator n=1 Tax=Nocardia acididurans TaxID=2802282 RepID=A0ABS1MGX4_9NOCA|nr:LysR substrate-binding domain-containing protein [Nocardia acididurans]MBL1079862.1 LysR family transcriptional regulator [Nocardia acididurans]